MTGSQASSSGCTRQEQRSCGASLAAGGVLSGEHGIGVEKQQYMELMFTPDDLDHQNRLRRAFDPACRSNPGKVIPASHSCADIQALRQRARGVWG